MMVCMAGGTMAQNYVIEGTVPDMDGQKVYMGEAKTTKDIRMLDSAVVKDGAFRMEGKLTEVKQLRLIGYTLIMGTNLLEEQFLNQLKGSTFFEDREGGSSLVKFTPGKEYNLSSFEILVKLKEPIRK